MAASQRAASGASRVLCRYFMNGACHEGSRCKFSHDRSDTPSMVCRYFLKGHCSYGPRCRYDHVRSFASVTDSPKRSDRSVVSGDSGSPVTTDASAVQPSPVTDSSSAASSSISSDSSGLPSEFVGHVVPSSTGATIAPSASTSKLRAEAQEFVPSAYRQSPENAGTSYAAVAAAGCSVENVHVSKAAEVALCPYFEKTGECPFGDECMFVHGDTCDLCGGRVLVPGDTEQNARHRRECVAEHEKQMEVAFTLARSKGMQCGICMEVVMDKPNEYSRRFGILPNCKHCFCLDCLRKWRQTKQFDTKNIRSCPECRVMSDFVIPSTFWVDTDEEKACLTEVYKASMKSKNCKYFSSVDGECPFGNKCFYRHVRPDGVVVEGDSPRTVRRRMRRNNSYFSRRYAPSADLSLLWDFLEERNEQLDSGSDSNWLWDFPLEDELDMISLEDSDSDSDFGFWDLLWY